MGGRGCSVLLPTDNGIQRGIGGTEPQLPQKSFFFPSFFFFFFSPQRRGLVLSLSEIKEHMLLRYLSRAGPRSTFVSCITTQRSTPTKPSRESVPVPCHLPGRQLQEAAEHRELPRLPEDGRTLTPELQPVGLSASRLLWDKTKEMIRTQLGHPLLPQFLKY